MQISIGELHDNWAAPNYSGKIIREIMMPTKKRKEIPLQHQQYERIELTQITHPFNLSCSILRDKVMVLVSILPMGYNYGASLYRER